MTRQRPAGSCVDLAEWIGYFKDIGVRELSTSTGVSSGSPAVVRQRPRREEGREASDAPPVPGGHDAGWSAASSESGLTVGQEGDSRRAAAPRSPGARPGRQSTLSLWDAPADEAADPVTRLREIREDLGDCTRCKLHAGRKNIVFGVGDPRAGLMFIGEGPGADEDAQGEPFVGRAGQKLNEMIRAIGLEREQVYIANVIKCRPPDNRDPQPDEVATCSPFLFRQIEAIRPAVIVTLGSPATKLLLNTSEGITKLRGRWHEYRGIPLLPTFHPAYLLRAYTKENRQKVWEDLKAARARLDERS